MKNRPQRSKSLRESDRDWCQDVGSSEEAKRVQTETVSDITFFGGGGSSELWRTRSAEGHQTRTQPNTPRKP